MRSQQATMRLKRALRKGNINLGICTVSLCIISYLSAAIKSARHSLPNARTIKQGVVQVGSAVRQETLSLNDRADSDRTPFKLSSKAATVVVVGV